MRPTPTGRTSTAPGTTPMGPASRVRAFSPMLFGSRTPAQRATTTTRGTPRSTTSSRRTPQLPGRAPRGLRIIRLTCLTTRGVCSWLRRCASYALIGSLETPGAHGALSGAYIVLTDGADEASRERWAAAVLETGLFY